MDKFPKKLGIENRGWKDFQKPWNHKPFLAIPNWAFENLFSQFQIGLLKTFFGNSKLGFKKPFFDLSKLASNFHPLELWKHFLTFSNLSTTTFAMSIWTNDKPIHLQIGILNTLEWEWRNLPIHQSSFKYKIYKVKLNWPLILVEKQV